MHPVELDVLPGGDVAVTIPPDRTRLGSGREPVHYLADALGLLGLEAAAGDLHAQHESVAALALRVDAHPLQALHLTVHLGDGAGSLDRVGLLDSLGDVQRVARELPLL